MTPLTPPSTAHRSEKNSSAKYAFSVTIGSEVPKLAVSTVSSTPPATSSPIDAETPASASSRNVIWSLQNSYHSLATPPKPRMSAAATNALVRERPIRPILKRRKTSPLKDASNNGEAGPSSRSDAVVDIPEDLDSYFRGRETTPEPADALSNLNYLEYPLSLILKPNARLRELTEGYHILNVRLRSNVQYGTEADTWPLFNPLRANASAFVECVVRDLKRAFIDPLTSKDCPQGDGEIPNENWENEEPTKRAVSLPSPKATPRKVKKKGMSAEQVKFARDLCTTTHAVLKLLCVALCYPAIHGIFDSKQLKAMLTGIVAIPMEEKIPTPNARKTCALAIMVLQCQRLGAEVLAPTASRIAFALKRGIDGELGKEGKKGSAHDGLKAIGDLSIYQPSTFVPVFATAAFLPSVLNNLLASTLALRTQACVALSGIAYALASQPPSKENGIHAAASDIVAEFMLTVAPTSPSKPAAPVKSGVTTLSVIMRTLRQTMLATEFTHVAQSPVWSLCVLSSMIVILGSRMYTDRKVCGVLMTVFKAGAKCKKAAIRHLFCAAWRAVCWAWFQPDYDLLAKEDDGESEKEDEEGDDQSKLSKVHIEQKRKTREAYFQIMQEIVEVQAALSTVSALLSSPTTDMSHLGIRESPQDEALRRALDVLDAMARNSNPDTINDASEALNSLLSTEQGLDRPSPLLANSALAILPKGLFVHPPSNGLFFVDFSIVGSGNGSLWGAVKPLLSEQPGPDAVRALTKDELRKDWVWNGLMKVWRTILGSVQMSDTCDLPDALRQPWETLLHVSVGGLAGGDASELASRAAGFLIDILLDPKLNLTIKSGTSSPEYNGPTLFTNAELKVKVVKSLWSAVTVVFAKSDLGDAAEKLLQALLENCSMLTEQRKKKLRSISANKHHVIAPVLAWADLCATVILNVGDGGSDTADAMKTFWQIDLDDDAKSHWDDADSLQDGEVKSGVWKAFVDVWKQHEGHWEAAVVLLAAPFVESPTTKAQWSIGSEETSRWKEMYPYALDKALDDGMDASATTIVDCVSEIVTKHISTTTPTASLVLATDLVMSFLEPADMREVPVHLLSLLNATLAAGYPREETDMTWFVQTLTTFIEKSPKELVKDLVLGLEENMTVWLRDDRGCWTSDDLDYTFVHLYAHLLLRIQEVPKDLKFLAAISPLLDSVFAGRVMPKTNRASFKEAFKNFWEISPYSKMEEPVGGWPEPLCHCLEVQLDDEAEVMEVPSTPSRKTFKKLSADGIFPRTPMLPMNGSNIPSPRRPNKPHADSGVLFFPAPDRSPLSPVRKRRISGGPVSSLESSPFARQSGMQFPESPSKRRRGVDHEDEILKVQKENNASPQASPKRRRLGLGPSVFEFKPVALDFGRSADVALDDVFKVSDAAPESSKKQTTLREKMGRKPAKSLSGSATRPDAESLGLSARRTRSSTLPDAGRLRSSSPAVSESGSLCSNDSEEERTWVERALVPFPTDSQAGQVDDEAPAKDGRKAKGAAPGTSSLVNEPPTPAAQKRKRLPSASEMIENTRANSRRKLDHLPAAWSTPLTKLGRTMGRSQTAPMPMSTLRASTGAKKMANARQRLLVRPRSVQKFAMSDPADAIEDPFEAEVRTTKPLPALRILPSPPPKVVETEVPSSDGPSSDDSQHLGQVTPHHLISPQIVARAARVYSSKAFKLDFSAAGPSSSQSIPATPSSKLSATSQVLRARTSSLAGGADVPGSDDSVDGAPDSSPTRSLAERRRRVSALRPSVSLPIPLKGLSTSSLSSTSSS